MGQSNVQLPHPREGSAVSPGALLSVSALDWGVDAN